MIPWEFMWIILKAHNNKGALLMWPVVTAQLSYSVERKDSLVFSVCLHLLCHSHDVKGWKGNSNLAVFSGAIVVVETHHLIFLTLVKRAWAVSCTYAVCMCTLCVYQAEQTSEGCVVAQSLALFDLAFVYPFQPCPVLPWTPPYTRILLQTWFNTDGAWQRELILSGSKLDMFNTSVWSVWVLSFAS